MYIIEGNMGVGKSTFLKLLKQRYPKIDIKFEPREKWMDNSLLVMFFENPKRWEYTIETFIMMCRVKDYLQLQKQKNSQLVLERSVYGGHFCYAQVGYESGYMTELEWKLYNEWADFLIKDQCLPPKGFIYLKASPETCVKRVEKRNWKSEECAPKEFIESLHKWHERFLIQKKNLFENLKDIPVLVLDVTEGFETNTKLMDDHARKVMDFMDQTQIMPHIHAATPRQTYL
jgi:deoxyguanosine kinase